MEAIITGLATGITTLLGLIVAVIYLLNRIDSRIEASNAELRSEIREALAEMREIGSRVSETELKQARLDAQNEILLRQTHTHEGSGGDD